MHLSQRSQGSAIEIHLRERPQKLSRLFWLCLAAVAAIHLLLLFSFKIDNRSIPAQTKKVTVSIHEVIIQDAAPKSFWDEPLPYPQLEDE